MQRALLLSIVFGLAVCLALPHPGHAQRRPKRSKPAPVQGIRGQVIYLSGNFMPGPDGSAGGTRKPVARKLLLFAPPLDADIMESGALDGPFVDLGKRIPVYTVRSGRDGRFRLRLEPGTYSLIVQEPDGRYFCNGQDGEGRLCPITIDKGCWRSHTVEINHAAVY